MQPGRRQKARRKARRVRAKGRRIRTKMARQTRVRTKENMPCLRQVKAPRRNKNLRVMCQRNQ